MQCQTWVNKTVQETMTIVMTKEEEMVAEDHQEVALEAEEKATKERATTIAPTARTIATTKMMLMATMGTAHPKTRLNVQPKI